MTDKIIHTIKSLIDYQRDLQNYTKNLIIEYASENKSEFYRQFDDEMFGKELAIIKHLHDSSSTITTMIDILKIDLPEQDNKNRILLLTTIQYWTPKHGNFKIIVTDFNTVDCVLSYEEYDRYKEGIRRCEKCSFNDFFSLFNPSEDKK